MARTSLTDLKDPHSYIGTGSPEGAVTAGIGSIYRRTDGSSGTSLYIKESGSGNTGWVAVASGSVGFVTMSKWQIGA